jgi:uncharacterized membrane protein HdeD (DUF308 family)
MTTNASAGAAEPVLPVLSRNWWALALRGIVAILFGLAAFFLPGITLAVLILLFGAFALVDGIFAIVAAVRTHRRNERWWLLLVEGVLGVLAGVVAFLWPGLTALALLYLVAAWAIITGVLEIVGAIRLRKEIEGEWALILGGILSVIFGVLLAALPGVGILALVWLIGAYAIVAGVLLLAAALRARRSEKASPREGMPHGGVAA